MNRSDFERSLAAAGPPEAAPALVGLWHAKRGDWDAAHRAVQTYDSDSDCAWVHAYLHRWEGDIGNAAYWYRRAGKPTCRRSLDEEWEELAAALTQP